ncbi:chemotaxis protein CheW [Bosea sp. 117]|uniref:chemotaxis protein CheW n=1 Tax=Bosea sp. 117 TaxID=1125973 RepID=UPI00069240F6|nr:chemotaxis protein CheW [Bosea sp. 117]
MEPCRIDIVTFALDGVRFALPRRDVIEIMPVERARWSRLARMAENGTLGPTGLPLLHLSARLGIAPEAPPAASALMLVGGEGRPRGVVLIDAEPFIATADCLPIAASHADAVEPQAGLIAGTARLPDGLRAILLRIPTGIADERLRTAAEGEPADCHLLVRLAEGHELCVAPVSALRGTDRPCRLLVEAAEGESLAVEAVEGPAPAGRMETIAGIVRLVTPGGIYRVLGAREESRPADRRTPSRPRLLIVAPQPEERPRLRALARELGYGVSLADDPRAVGLARRRFDVVLIDLDGFGDIAAPIGEARLIGLARGAAGRPVPGFDMVVQPDDEVALLAALLPRQSRAA